MSLYVLKEYKSMDKHPEIAIKEVPSKFLISFSSLVFSFLYTALFQREFCFFFWGRSMEDPLGDFMSMNDISELWGTMGIVRVYRAWRHTYRFVWLALGSKFQSLRTGHLEESGVSLCLPELFLSFVGS